jgi:plastocyanin
MSWIPGMFEQHRRSKRAGTPAIVEVLEARALMATVDVHVLNFAFNPNPVTINVGDTVHWIWDTSFHSTTSVAGSLEQWDSGVLNAGATFDHTFTHAGTFVYYCTIHGHDNGNGTASGMAADVVVSSPTPTPTPMPTPTPTPTAPPLGAIGESKTVKLGKTFHKAIARFSERQSTPGQFMVMIDWGDQSGDTVGQVRRKGRGKYAAIGTHQYQAKGVFQVTVMIMDTHGQMVDANSSVKVK